jgi:subtilisin family serine protease
MRQIDADDAWTAVPQQGQGALVCVLDTGIDPNHQELIGRVDLAKSASFVPSEPFIFDLNAHGTFVSALITGNSVDMASVAPHTKVCALKVLDQNGNGEFSWLIAAIVDASDKGADVINMSLGAYFSRNEPGARELIRSLQKAVNYAVDHGVLVVASAGNDTINLDTDPPDMIHIPSQLKNVISVGATAPVNQQNFDKPTTYTNFGGRTGVDIMAPGGDLVAGGQVRDLILSACSSFVCGAPFFYLLGGGTSFSAPHVAAAAAVLESAFPGNQRGKQLGNCILRGADQVTALPSSLYGHGRLNVLKAVTKCDLNNDTDEDQGNGAGNNNES